MEALSSPGSSSGSSPPEEAPLERYAAAAAATAGLGAAWILFRDAVPVDVSCPLLSTTGIPCPFCGITRLGDLLAHGHLAEAVTHDPAGVVLLVAIAMLALVGVAARLGWRPRRWPAATAVVAILVGALAAHWATTLLGGGFVTAASAT
jgi:hypothetical protein